MNADVYHDAVAAVPAIISAISVAISTIAVARINATRTEVSEAKREAADANTAAVAARDSVRPIGNGYADESLAALARIEAQLADLHQRHVRTNAWLTKHLADHARHDLHGDERGTL